MICIGNSKHKNYFLCGNARVFSEYPEYPDGTPLRIYQEQCEHFIVFIAYLHENRAV